MPMTPMVRELFLRLVWQAWQLLATRTLLEANASEVARLQNLVGHKETSIWNMKKADLVEVARKELGLTWVAAEQETVIVLRELIRRARRMMEALTDPLAEIPVGLNKMPHPGLMAEIEARQLIVPAKGTAPPTRPAMILAIRDDVARRLLISQPETPPTKTTSSAQNSTADWEMVEEKKATRRKV